MANREMDFAEFKERVGARGQKGNAVGGLWNVLAEYLLGFQRSNDEPANCLLPVDTLRRLTPREVKSIPGMGPARVTVFGALYQSLRENPDALRDRTLEISREGLAAFAPSNTAKDKTRASVAWRGLFYGVGATPTVDQIAAFCATSRSGGERVPGFGGSHIELLERWVEHLRKSR